VARRVENRSAGVSVVVLRGAGNQTETLLLRRAKGAIPGAWCQVAGGIEIGEMAWETAVRELREETALTPKELHAAGMCEQYYDPKRDRIEIVPVFVAMVEGDAVVELNDEHSEYKWVSFNSIDDYLAMPNQREMFAHVRRHFVQRNPSDWTRIALTTQ
jgi:dATP pyrophosphohydrolase